MVALKIQPPSPALRRRLRALLARYAEVDRATVVKVLRGFAALEPDNPRAAVFRDLAAELEAEAASE